MMKIVLFFNAYRVFKEQYIQNIVQPLKIIEKRYINRNKLLKKDLGGFSIGLYHLHNPA